MNRICNEKVGLALIATLNGNLPNKKNLMGKKRWTSPDQQAWLETLIPAFIEAQQEKGTKMFFEKTYDMWHETWPTAVPTEGEIRDAEGSAEKALALKRKFDDSVSVH